MKEIKPFTATIWKLGDNVNTDMLHPPDYFSLNEDRMKAGVHEGMQRLQSTDLTHRPHHDLVIVAGNNFGCGSSRETSVRALRAVGVRAVVAKSFGRIFFRSLFNLGLLPLTCDQFPDDIQDGEEITIDADQGQLILTGRPPYPIKPLDPHVKTVIACGGLISYLKNNLSPKT